MKRRNYLKSVGASFGVPFIPASFHREQKDEEGTAIIRDYGHTTVLSTDTDSTFLILEFGGRNRKVFLSDESEHKHIVHQRNDRVERVTSPNGEIDIRRQDCSGEPRLETLQEAVEVDEVEYIGFGVVSDEVLHIDRNITWGKYERLNFDEFTQDGLWIRRTLDVVNEDEEDGYFDSKQIYTYPVGDEAFLDWIPQANRIKAYGETVDGQVNKIPVFRQAKK